MNIDGYVVLVYFYKIGKLKMGEVFIIVSVVFVIAILIVFFLCFLPNWVVDVLAILVAIFDVIASILSIFG